MPRLDSLVALDLLEDAPVVEAPRNAPVRYRVSDPALRFHHAFVSPQASLIERSAPLEVYDAVVQPRLDTFLGPAVERLLAPTYDRIRRSRDLPLVQEWGRWEGRDRSRRPVELDVVARLASGGTMTGSVKWNQRPRGVEVIRAHLESITRAADAGMRWAHEGRDGPLVFLAAGGYDARFLAAAEAHPARVVAWTLEDVYAEV